MTADIVTFRSNLGFGECLNGTDFEDTSSVGCQLTICDLDVVIRLEKSSVLQLETISFYI